MPTINQFSLLAKYNQLMNQRQYKATARLSMSELCEDKGAFFKSVLGTLNHIMVGDIIWLKRFFEHSNLEVLPYILQREAPKSLNTVLFTDFEELKKERETIDEIIISWIKSLTDCDLNKCITYTSIDGKSFTKPFAGLIYHLFLHQVHHRGQVTTLLAQYGVDFGETDLIEIINVCKAQ